MKKIFIYSFIIAIVSSCLPFHEMYNLPPTPADNFVVEVREQSRIETEILYGDFAMYTQFGLTDENWAQYLSVVATIYSPFDMDFSDEMTVGLDDDDNFRLEHYSYWYSFIEGSWEMEMFARDADGNEETYSVPFLLGFSSSADKWLAPRTEPIDDLFYYDGYLFEEEPMYEVAIADDGNSIFIRPLNTYSASVNNLVYFYERLQSYHSSGYVKFILPLVASELNVGSWTEYPVSSLIPQVGGSPSIEVTDARGDNPLWYVRFYTIDPQSGAKGTIFRTFLSEGEFEDIEPSMAGATLPAFSRAFHAEYPFEIPPLAPVIGPNTDMP
jgi:hypothetical protein